jgi:di/tricarboxylate transporter
MELQQKFDKSAGLPIWTRRVNLLAQLRLAGKPGPPAIKYVLAWSGFGEGGMSSMTPDTHGLAVLLLTALALVLFTRDKLPLETSSLIVLISLVAIFQFFPYERDGQPLEPSDFLMGFGNEALITICALMIVAKTLEVTGALKPLAIIVNRAWSARPILALLVTIVVGAALSAFVNNTPIIVLLLPILVGMSSSGKFPVSRVMLPMGLATIVGGTTTTIGTSTNLLVVGISADLGLERFGMFDFFLPGVIVGGTGLLFLWLVAPRLLANRIPPIADASLRVFDGRLSVDIGSAAAGLELSEVLAMTGGKMKIDRIQRSESLFLARLPWVRLQPGDRLFVRDTPENLKHYEQQLGATLYTASDAALPETLEDPVAAGRQQLAQIVVTRGSALDRRSLADIGFIQRYRLLPLALHRARSGMPGVTGDIDSVKLRAGDVILVQGPSDALESIRTDSSILMLEGTTDVPHPRRAKRAVATMLVVILAAALGIIPIVISALIGVALVLALGCISWRDASRAISLPIVMLIVASRALGKALTSTGMADFLAGEFVNAASSLSTPYMLSALILVVAVLTNIVSNNAAAAIGTPIAISIAYQVGADPVPFVLAVLFGANMSYATPFGYHDNLLIMSAGGYTFGDFVRVGVPLLLIMWLGFSIVLPLLYDLSW